MLRPSKKLALALEAVVDIAHHGAAEPVQSQDIGRRLNLPRRYLEQVMQQLVRAGVLRGVRGPRGGYRLAKEKRKITVAEVVRVVQRSDDEENQVAFGSEIGRRVMSPFWHDLERKMMKELESVTIEDFTKDAEKYNIKEEKKADADFTI